MIQKTKISSTSTKIKQEVMDEENLKMKQKSSTEGPGDGGEPSLPTLKMEI